MGWREIIVDIMREDIGFRDITTAALLPKNMELRAEMVAIGEGICAGVEEAAHLLKSNTLHVNEVMKEGSEMHEGDVLLEVSGNSRRLFEAERTALNIIQRMSGIATMTKKAVKLAREVNPKVRITCTRKTVLGYLDKKSVGIGGGDPERWTLADEIIIKRNHLRIVGSVEECLRRAKAHVSFTKKICIEVNNANDALEAAKYGADVVMFDNMPFPEIEKSLKMLKESGLRDKVIVEVSGGITLEKVKDYAKYDVDFISMGCLTHSPKAIDVNLRLLLSE
ncbi:MAG: Quinolinate phosphoribosyltransferase [decarboxylating] [Candidatus Fermentimicrarchaeum limneticum]|uniref:Nicotinate-nucleotide pyrophosphorylase [carboxylating] n=1 Tax=Fermentimicrarchaeum limneticum TaxID=2795018 RepID=A0A7D5XJJ1_FERL1|nr:MAG: Quinolinate phosphoribosyltransferase [decarboxylating] [Candidatus Fermentimicrarchaeum limneticum]